MSLKGRIGVYVCVLALLLGACRRTSNSSKPHGNNAVDVGVKPVQTKSQEILVRQGNRVQKTTIETEPILDGCSMEVASSILKKTHPAIKICGQSFAERSRKRPVGKMIFALLLQKDGWPRKIAATTDEIGDAIFTGCIKEALKIRFPNPFGKECIIQAPFTFTANPRER